MPDVGPPGEKLFNRAVKLCMGVVEAREVRFFEDRGPESGFREDHHPGGALQKMRACPGTDDKKEGVLYLAVQPDDAGQPAEHLALSALFEHRRGPAAGGRGRGELIGHASPSACSRAARSFQTN